MFSRKAILPLVAALALLVPAWVWGNALTVFLCFVVIGMLVYYLRYTAAEARLDARLEAALRGGAPAEVSEAKAVRGSTLRGLRWMLSLGILTVLYLGSVFCLNLFVYPRGKTPYFLNTDYHYITNTGLRFPQRLVLYTAASSPAAPGLWPCNQGTLTAVSAGSSVALEGQDFFEPVFEDTTRGKGLERFYAAVHTPWDADVSTGFTLSAGGSSLRVRAVLTTDSARWYEVGSNPRTVLSGIFESRDSLLLREAGLPVPYTDTFHVYLKEEIQTGLSLRDLLIRPETWSSGGLGTRGALESWVTNTAPVYLLAHYAQGGKRFVIFPTGKAVAAGCRLYNTAGTEVPLSRTFRHAATPGTRLYCGFGAASSAFTIAPDAAGGRLSFAWLRYFPLRAGKRGATPAGTGAVRALRNHYSGFLSSPLEEGYLFHEDLRPGPEVGVDGHLTYTADRPGAPLRASVYDGAAGTNAALFPGKEFSLHSRAGGSEWVYAVRDFSAGGVRYGTIFWTLTGLYLLMAATLIFWRREALDRIEPPLYYLLYALVFTRFILLWRIATFPPAEDASPRELAQYTGAELLFGFLPVTAVFLLGLFLLIIGWRAWGSRFRNRQPGLVHPSASGGGRGGARTGTIGARIQSLFWNTPPAVLRGHLSILLLASLIATAAGRLGYDILVRTGGILLPVASYLIACQRLRALGEEPAAAGSSAAAGWRRAVQRFFVRLYDSRETILSLSTFGLLAVLDRGFAILFLLFLLFKTIAVSFGRKPFVTPVVSGAQGVLPVKGEPFVRMFTRPENYWMYGVIALLLYLAFLLFPGLFHTLLRGRWIVAAAVAGLAVLTALSMVRSVALRRKILLGTGVVVLLTAVLFGPIDRAFNNEIKHVAHRASLIYQPVDAIIAASEYKSFDERKILETAESQWFINSYQNKPYDRSRRIALRPHFDRGVTYLTQTRDVVLPRYVIAEHGEWTMILLLLILALPVVLYFVSYRLYRFGDYSGRIAPAAYAGTLALVLLFTIGLFVWLTSTNRFVFFGQDFPLLSLASKVGIALPLMLLLAVLLSTPERARVGGAPMQRRWWMWGVFGATVAAVILVTGKSNYQSEESFTVRMEETERLVNGRVNDLLAFYQDSTARPGREPDIRAALRWLKRTEEFGRMADTASRYTRSVLRLLTDQPARATQPTSPVYLRYDGEDERYSVSYNRNLYLELPAYEDAAEWTGDVYEAGTEAGAGAAITLADGTYIPDRLPYAAGSGPVRVAVLPAAWMADKKSGPLALVNIENTARGGATLRIYPGGGRTAVTQSVRGWVHELPPDGLAYAVQGGRPYPVRFAAAGGRAFARNHLINGRRRLLYPLAERCTWAAQYGRAADAAFSTDSTLHRGAPVTLDYALTDTVAGILSRAFPDRSAQPANFRFAVVAADGTGAVRLMADWAKNREAVDPNNRRRVEQLEADYFFRSNARAERDQWGNVNLLHLAKGPGSSIKPVIASAVASSLAAEWKDMVLALPAGSLYPSKKAGLGELHSYAGFKLSIPWRESHGGDFVPADFITYLVKSNNLYHSLFLFLGSYPKSAFLKDGRYSLRNVLASSAPAGGRTPTVILGGTGYALPQWGRGGGGWPRTAPDAQTATFFGNEESLLARGLAFNFGLFVDDDDKADLTLAASAKAAFGDPLMFDSLGRRPIGGYLWSFPEESSFIQALRAYADPAKNFADGLRNPTLGGTPYAVTPLKMAEMYGRLATRNRALRLHVAPRQPAAREAFDLDDTWTPAAYESFLRDAVLAGMEGVLTSGTAAGKLPGGARYPAGGRTLYAYAKTGTISETSSNVGAGNSRRLALILSTEDLRGENAAQARIYTIYFTADKMKSNADAYGIYNEILRALVTSRSFKNYMGL